MQAAREAKRRHLHFQAKRERKLVENIPILYDTYIHYSLGHESYACAWGPLVGGDANSSSRCQTIYFSRGGSEPLSLQGSPTESGVWTGQEPNMLIVAEVDVPMPGTSDLRDVQHLEDAIAGHVEERRISEVDGHVHESTELQYHFHQGQEVRVIKRIIHPGDINNIKPVPQYPEIVATHTDWPDLYIWNTDTQPTRRTFPAESKSQPDLTLVGHSHCPNNYFYAIDIHQKAPLIISGGEDQRIVLWSLEDYCSSLGLEPYEFAPVAAPGRLTRPVKRAKVEDNAKLQPRHVYSNGHKAEIQNLSWNQKDVHGFASVGDDRICAVWDTRTPGGLWARLQTGHTDRVGALSWNPVRSHLLLTGSHDRTLRLLDLRKASSSTLAGHGNVKKSKDTSHVVWSMSGHQCIISNVQWANDGNYALSIGADAVHLWDLHVPRRGGQLVRANKSRKGKKFDVLAELHDRPQEPHLHHASASSGLSSSSYSSSVAASDSDTNISSSFLPSDVASSTTATTTASAPGVVSVISLPSSSLASPASSSTAFARSTAASTDTATVLAATNQTRSRSSHTGKADNQLLFRHLRHGPRDLVCAAFNPYLRHEMLLLSLASCDQVGSFPPAVLNVWSPTEELFAEDNS